MERCQAVAGLSLGEYTALAVAGVFDFETGLKVVKLRGEAMQVLLVGWILPFMPEKPGIFPWRFFCFLEKINGVLIRKGKKGGKATCFFFFWGG